MGHLCIVDGASLPFALKSKTIRVRASVGSKSSRPGKVAEQLADLLADALIIRPGDCLVPWITKQRTGASFRHHCSVSSRALFDFGAPDPIVIPLRPEVTEYPGLAESEALNLWTSRLLWNAVGKKSLGRGRGITHQTPREDEELLHRLRVTGGGEALDGSATARVDGLLPITIRTESHSSQSFPDLQKRAPKNRLSALRLDDITWADGSKFRVEKALEAWLAENFDTKKGGSFRSAILEDGETIKWAANYLPFGVAGASIDFALQTATEEGESRFHVIELKRDALSKSEFGNAVEQVQRYVAFFESFLQSWDSGKSTVAGHIISAATARPNKHKSVAHSTYAIGHDGGVLFERI